jgi:hypothetical protein
LVLKQEERHKRLQFWFQLNEDSRAERKHLSLNVGKIRGNEVSKRGPIFFRPNQTGFFPKNITSFEMKMNDRDIFALKPHRIFKIYSRAIITEIFLSFIIMPN